MEFIIVTGLSGSGKTRALHSMEDIGYYCVDNIPPKLIPKIYELCDKSVGNMSKVAVVTDIRGGVLFDSLLEVLEQMEELNYKYKILFLDAMDEVLKQRYKETRRPHPLAEDTSKSIHSLIKLERDLLGPFKERADYLIDTTLLTQAQLKNRICNIFMGNTSSGLIVNCMSFGFKYGLPSESDIVLDVRCLLNPFYIDELKKMTGKDNAIKEFVMKSEDTQQVFEKFKSLMDYMIPLYCSEGKSQLVISFGCTGGKHRSVTLAEEMYNYLISKNIRASVTHRDIQKI